jgi:hypothetical protein
VTSAVGCNHFPESFSENLQRLDIIFVEEVAKIGRHVAIKGFT